jgi:hypothetical protein
MYVQLNVEFISKTIELFCQRKDIQMKKKDAKKVFALLVEDEDVEKYNLCKGVCAKSGRPCMKEVGEGAYCHLHDPKYKCRGVTKKGDRCKCTVKVGEKFCRHHIPEEPVERRHTKNKHIPESDDEHVEESHKRSKSVKRRKKRQSPDEPKSVKQRKDVTSEHLPNENSDEPKSKKSRKKSHDESESPEKHKRSIAIPEAKMNPDAENLTLDNLAPGMFYGWVPHPKNDKLEYSVNYTINDKCIVKMVGKHAYVELCDPKRMHRNIGHAPEISVPERTILEKMGLRKPFPIEEAKLYDGMNIIPIWS